MTYFFEIFLIKAATPGANNRFLPKRFSGDVFPENFHLPHVDWMCHPKN